MWLNFIILIAASLCVGFILGWIVARPRRWGAFGTEVAEQDPASVDTFARGA